MMQNSNQIEYELITSKRKTYAITINKDGKVIVRTPIKYSQKFVDDFLQKQQTWISQKLKEVEKKISKKVNYEFKNGEMISLMGEKFPLIISNTAPHAYNFDKKQFIVHSNYLHNIKIYLEDTFKKLARVHFKMRLDALSYQFNLPYKSMKLSSAYGRWGSCSTSGNINLVWRLIMAPLKVIDYVIIHELAHIKHHNHSDAFWNLVEYMMPDYRLYEKWLHENSYSLSLD